MAAILFPLTDDLAGALRATLNTRLHEVERHLRAVPQVYGDDQRAVYAKQLRTLLTGLEGGISKSLRKFSPSASDAAFQAGLTVSNYWAHVVALQAYLLVHGEDDAREQILTDYREWKTIARRRAA